MSAEPLPDKGKRRASDRLTKAKNFSRLRSRSINQLEPGLSPEKVAAFVRVPSFDRPVSPQPQPVASHTESSPPDVFDSESEWESLSEGESDKSTILEGFARRMSSLKRIHRSSVSSMDGKRCNESGSGRRKGVSIRSVSRRSSYFSRHAWRFLSARYKGKLRSLQAVVNMAMQLDLHHTEHQEAEDVKAKVEMVFKSRLGRNKTLRSKGRRRRRRLQRLRRELTASYHDEIRDIERALSRHGKSEPTIVNDSTFSVRKYIATGLYKEVNVEPVYPKVETGVDQYTAEAAAGAVHDSDLAFIRNAFFKLAGSESEDVLLDFQVVSDSLRENDFKQYEIDKLFNEAHAVNANKFTCSEFTTMCLRALRGDLEDLKVVQKETQQEPAPPHISGRRRSITQLVPASPARVLPRKASTNIFIRKVSSHSKFRLGTPSNSTGSTARGSSSSSLVE